MEVRGNDMDIKNTIQKALEKALDTLGAAGASFTLEYPGELSHGDYMTNAALIAGKMLGKKLHQFPLPAPASSTSR